MVGGEEKASPNPRPREREKWRRVVVVTEEGAVEG